MFPICVFITLQIYLKFFNHATQFTTRGSPAWKVRASANSVNESLRGDRVVINSTSTLGKPEMKFIRFAIVYISTRCLELYSVTAALISRTVCTRKSYVLNYRCFFFLNVNFVFIAFSFPAPFVMRCSQTWRGILHRSGSTWTATVLFPVETKNRWFVVDHFFTNL